MAAPLTIDNFELDKFRAKSPETKSVEMLLTIRLPSNTKIENPYKRLRVTLDCLGMKTRELATLWQLEAMIGMRNSLPNGDKGWLNSPMNKMVKF